MGFLRVSFIMRLAGSRGKARRGGRGRPENQTARHAEGVTGGKVLSVVLVRWSSEAAGDHRPAGRLWEDAPHRLSRCAADQGPQLGGAVYTAMQPTVSLPPCKLQIVELSLFGAPCKVDRFGT